MHFVDEGTDTGPIILQKAVEVQQGDTPEVLQRRVMEQAEWKILPKAIDLIANGKVRVDDHKQRFCRNRGIGGWMKYRTTDNINTDKTG